MIEVLKFISFCIIAYLCGAIPFAYIFPKIIKGADVRKGGTGNVGISNAYMVGGPIAGTLTFIFDHIKGVLPMLFAYFVGGWTFTQDLWSLLILTIFAMIGHSFPVFLKFKGGKSLCIAYGSILFLGPFYWITGNATLGITLFPKSRNTMFKIANIQVLFLMLYSGLMWYLETKFNFGYFAWKFTDLLPEGSITNTLPLTVMSVVWTVVYMARRCLFTGAMTDIKDGISPWKAIYLRAIYEMYPKGSKVKNPGDEIQMIEGED